MPALVPSGKGSSRPSDNASSRLSRNCCALPSSHTSAHPLRPRLPSPHPVTPVLAPSGNACDLPPVMPALAPPALPALALSRDSCALPFCHGGDRHACARLLRSRLRARQVRRSPPPVTLSPAHFCNASAPQEQSLGARPLTPAATLSGNAPFRNTSAPP